MNIQYICAWRGRGEERVGMKKREERDGIGEGEGMKILGVVLTDNDETR